MTILPSIEFRKEILILLKLVQNPIKLSNENLGEFSIFRPVATIQETMSSLVESNIHLSSAHKHPLTINQMSSQCKICLPSLKICIVNTARGNF